MFSASFITGALKVIGGSMVGGIPVISGGSAVVGAIVTIAVVKAIKK